MSCAVGTSEQEGLLTRTLEGAYVSFDQDKHWQNAGSLPATPVTDIKVHHWRIVATMGWSFS